MGHIWRGTADPLPPEEMSSIDHVIVQFLAGHTAVEVWPHFVDATDHGTIRVLDLVFIGKERDEAGRAEPWLCYIATANSSLAVAPRPRRA